MTAPILRPDPFRLGGVVVDGRFHVDREVAEGGFGVVYYAIQVALDRPVALKVLKTPPGMDQAARAHFHDKFEAEAKTIARIRHPNIVDVYDFGVSKMPSGELAPWMALEWIHGKTLDDYLTARRGTGGQSPTEVLTLLRPVLRAFAYAHRDGIAHRDIKPANIMVVSNGTGGTTTETGALLRILDFGIAKVMNGSENPGSGQTRTAGMPAFSPQYAAPEQIAFGRTGPWTDVHALGLILTEMLVDEPPYQAKDVQLYEEVMAAKRPTPKSKGRNVGPWEAIIAKALALSPTERWRSAAELLVALDGTMEAATAASSPSMAAARAAPGSTLPLTAELASSLGHVATDSQVASGKGASPAISETRSIASFRSSAPSGDSSDSLAKLEGPRPWRRSVVGGVAVALVVAALVLVGLFMKSSGSRSPIPSSGEPPSAAAAPIPAPVIPSSAGSEGHKSVLSPGGSENAKETEVKPGESPPRISVPPSLPPSRPAGAARATSNPHGPTRRLSGPMKSNPTTPQKKPAEPAAKSTERLPIE